MCAQAPVCVHIYNNVLRPKGATVLCLTVKILLKSKTFSWNYFVVSEIVSTFALAFEKYTSLKQLKKEFFERFYINRQVVQEAVILLIFNKLV